MTHPPTRFDVIVIGGGLAGSVVAGRLAQAQRRVLVLEAGPDYGPRTDHRWPLDLLDATTVPASHDWGYVGPGSAGQRLTFDRCRVIGGCSAHNGTTQNVGWAGDYDDWASAGNPGWDAASLAPLFDSALGRFEARTYSEREIQPFHRAVIESAEALGITRVDDFDHLWGGAGVGCAPVSSTPDGVRVNAAFGYLDPVRPSGFLTVRGDAEVKRVRIQDGRAVGVDLESNGETESVDADLIVLCAGAYGSPEVLLRSGIGPRDHLSDVGLPVVHHLPGVGANLHDQPTAQLEYAATAALAREIAEFGSSAPVMEEQTIVKFRSPYAGSAPYDLHLYPWIEPDPSTANGWKCILPVGLLRPKARGTVRLDPNDIDGRAVIDTRYLHDDTDVATIVHGLEWALDLASSPSLARYLGEAILAPAADADLSTWVRRNHSHYWHPVGSCRMGPATDPDAVVDHAGRVHGLSGLYVCDASIFPDVPRGTTALPTAVIGERIAGLLTERTFS